MSQKSLCVGSIENLLDVYPKNTEQSHTEHTDPMPSDLFLVNKDTFYNICCDSTKIIIDSVTTAMHSRKLNFSSKKMSPRGQEYLPRGAK